MEAETDQRVNKRCLIEGSRGVRVLNIPFDINNNTSTGRLHGVESTSQQGASLRFSHEKNDNNQT